MSKDSSDTLFTLVKSLKKSEKRYFKIAVSDARDKKFSRLFDIVDRQRHFNDAEILKKRQNTESKSAFEYESSFVHQDSSKPTRL